MIENKRFKLTQYYDEDDFTITDTLKDEPLFFSENIVNKLNELTGEIEQLKSTNMEMEDYLARLEEENINLQIKLQKIRDYAKEDGEVKQGIIEKVILE